MYKTHSVWYVNIMLIDSLVFVYRGKVCDVFNLEHPVYGISVDPFNDNIFASAGEDGRILIFDTRLNAANGNIRNVMSYYIV